MARKSRKTKESKFLYELIIAIVCIIFGLLSYYYNSEIINNEAKTNELAETASVEPITAEETQNIELTRRR